MPMEKPKVDLRVFPYPRPLPKGWSHIMYALDLNEEETRTPGLSVGHPDGMGKVMLWFGTYNEEYGSFH